MVVINGVICNVFLGNRLNAGRTHMERVEVIPCQMVISSLEFLKKFDYLYYGR